jgi:hypothetical protein
VRVEIFKDERGVYEERSLVSELLREKTWEMRRLKRAKGPDPS